MQLVSQYDAFQDLPFSQGDTYKVADRLFRGSKFILTEREPTAWFESLCATHERLFRVSDLSKLTEKDVKAGKYLYEGYSYENISRFLTYNGRCRWDLLYNRKYYIERYEARNIDIKSYFHRRPSDLLVIDITTEINTERIGRFLGLNHLGVFAMPHRNRMRSSNLPCTRGSVLEPDSVSNSSGI